MPASGTGSSLNASPHKHSGLRLTKKTGRYKSLQHRIARFAVELPESADLLRSQRQARALEYSSRTSAIIVALNAQLLRRVTL